MNNIGLIYNYILNKKIIFKTKSIFIPKKSTKLQNFLSGTKNYSNNKKKTNKI